MNKDSNSMATVMVRSAMFAILLLLLILSPAILFVANKVLCFEIPDCVTAESAQYLSGGMERADLRKLFLTKILREKSCRGR